MKNLLPGIMIRRREKARWLDGRPLLPLPPFIVRIFNVGFLKKYMLSIQKVIGDWNKEIIINLWHLQRVWDKSPKKVGERPETVAKRAKIPSSSR